MSSYEQIRIIITKEGLTVAKLAKLLKEKTGKNYTQKSLQNKISLSSLRYDEIEKIAELLGYTISIEKNKYSV